jgi:hypothetical protein
VALAVALGVAVAVAVAVGVAVAVDVAVAVAVGVAVDVAVAVAVAVAVGVAVEVAVAVAAAVAVAVAVAVGVALAVAVAVALAQAAGAIAIISAHHVEVTGVYDVAACVPVEVLLNTPHPPVSLLLSAFRYMPVELNPVGGDAALLLILSYNHRTRSLLVVVIELAKGVVLELCWHSVVPTASSVVDGFSPVI